MIRDIKCDVFNINLVLEVITDLTLDTLQYNKSLPLTIAIILVTEVGNAGVELVDI